MYVKRKNGKIAIGDVKKETSLEEIKKFMEKNGLIPTMGWYTMANDGKTIKSIRFVDKKTKKAGMFKISTDPIFKENKLWSDEWKCCSEERRYIYLNSKEWDYGFYTY